MLDLVMILVMFVLPLLRNEGTKSTGLKYKLGRNNQVFVAELFEILRGSIMIADRVEDVIRQGVQKIIIFCDSPAALKISIPSVLVYHLRDF
jgi:hypothetical protein